MSSTIGSNMVGWELTYKLVEKDISRKSDIIVLLIHWILILKEDFKCICQKIRNETDSEYPSDLLPHDWNHGKIYSIRYVKNDILYELSGAKSDDMFIVNFLHVSGEVASTIVINIENTVTELCEPIDKLFNNSSELIERIQKQLIDATDEKMNEIEKTSEIEYLPPLSLNHEKLIKEENLKESTPHIEIRADTCELNLGYHEKF